MSLLLDTGNFEALYINGKVVNKMFFNGEKIYENSKWFAIGNKFSSTNINAAWGGSNKKLCDSTNTKDTASYCIGKIASSSYPRNMYCCGTNEKSSEFTDLGSMKSLYSAFDYLPINSFLECKNIYYVARFKQTTYDGDLLIKPFIKFMLGYANTTTKCLGKAVAGIGNVSADSTDEGLSFVCPSSYKGKTVIHTVKLSEFQKESLDIYTRKKYNVDFMCKAFKMDDSTNITTATAYYGGYLLLEV